MEAQAAAPLGPDDYSALRSMLTSDDASARTQGLALAKKLTPDEQKAFFTFQQDTNKGKGELTRTDNQVAFGVPPEAAAIGAVGIARAMGGAGVSMAGRAVAGAKAAVSQAAPTLKYEATKTALEKMGVPTPLAVVAAQAVAAYKFGGKAPEAPEEPATASAAPASPAASTPGAPAPPAAPAASTAAPQSTATAPPSALSPQQRLNEEAIAARRAAYQASIQPQAPSDAVMQRLSPATEAAVASRSTPSPRPQGILSVQIQGPDGPQSVGSIVGEMQKAGTPQAQIDRWLQGLERNAGQATPAATIAPAVPKPALLASETKEFVRLIQAGKTQKEALAAIQVQRDLQAQLGLTTPTAAETRFPKGMRGKPPGDDE